MASPSTTYEPRQPAQGVLYRVVRDHFETFQAQAAQLRDGEGLPRFVEEAFRGFLRCGWFGGGFARFRCQGCGFDRLVPFSCHGRGFCPSCAGRRMAERAELFPGTFWTFAREFSSFTNGRFAGSDWSADDVPVYSCHRGVRSARPLRTSVQTAG